MADGTLWWVQSGEEEMSGGKLCRWKLLRGQSADGATEWEEKWWETSDEWNYKELGAEKSGALLWALCGVSVSVSVRCFCFCAARRPG